jgi:branched-chain amino acid aminotransferase
LSPTYFINGSFVKKENAFIHVNDIGLLRGYAVFDYLKTYFGFPFRLDDHLERLQTSASIIGLSIPYTNEEIKNIFIELLAKNKFLESNIRIVVTGGVGVDSKTGGNPGFIITCEPRINLDESYYTQGVKIKTVSGKREIPLSKTTNYVNAVSYIAKYKSQGYSEYLYVFENYIYECTSSNVYMIKGNDVFTTDEGVLKGVTRKVIFEIVGKIFTIDIRKITLDEIMNSDEVFISSTEREVMPVTIINESKIGYGKVGENTKKIIKAFKDYVNSKVWVTH